MLASGLSGQLSALREHCIDLSTMTIGCRVESTRLSSLD